MKARMRLAIWLYPAKWRARYSREFAALLEDVGPGWRDWWDVALGGLKMRISWNFATVTVACAVLGVAVAAGFAMRAPDEYVSTAVLRMTPKQVADGWNVRPTPAAAQERVLSRTSLAEIIQRYDIYHPERTRLPMEDVVMNMRNRDVRIQPLGDAGRYASAFTISFQYPDRYKAQQVVQALAARFMDASKETAMEVLDPASLPQRPASPNRPVILGIGLAAGLFLGTLVFGVRRWPLVAGVAAAALAVSAIVAWSLPEKWTSVAILRIDGHGSVADIIRQFNAKNLRISTENTQKGIEIRVEFTDLDRFRAQAEVRKVVAKLAESNVSSRELRNLEVVTPATLPATHNVLRLYILLIGLAAGVGSGILLSRRRGPSPTTAAA